MSTRGYPHITADGARGSCTVKVSWLPGMNLRKESLFRSWRWNKVIKMSPTKLRIHITLCLTSNFCGKKGANGTMVT